MGQPSSFPFPNLGAWWTFNWVSWISLPVSNQAEVHVRGGGYEVYNYTTPDNVSNPYPPDVTSQAVLAVTGDGVYQRQLPDGSIEVFGITDGTNYYMTQVIDPQGNATTINYTTPYYRVSSITDANGQTTTINYLSNTYGGAGSTYYLISSIVDPSGRTATFTYDSTNTYLISITDAVGNVSQFNYSSGSSFINALTTPYGTTSFYSYVPGGSAAYPPQGLKTVYPDGSSCVIENWLGETKTSYYWDRQATALYPQDPGNRIYSHSKNTKFLFNVSSGYESPVINYVKKPLEAPVVYVTQGETGGDFMGTSNLPTSTTRSLSGNLNSAVSLSGTATAGDIVTVTVNDGLLTGGPESFAYTVLNSDTLSTIAAALANAINGDPVLPAIGVSAASNGTTLLVKSLSTNNTTVGAVANLTATETVSSGTSPATVTIGGTPTVGNQVNLQVQWSGGTQTVQYTVAGSPPTLNTIAQGLANQLNLNATLAAAGFSANSVGSTVYLSSTVAGTVTYTPSVTATASEALTLFTNGSSAILGGSITPTDNPGIVFTDSSLPGGSETVSYKVQSEDSLAAVAAGLAAAINLDSNLQTLGVSASAVGTNLTIQSASANHTTYAQTSGGATETITFNSSSINVLQTSSAQYNAAGKVTQSVDPIGRTFSYIYAANNIDLLEKRETKLNGSTYDNYLMGKWEYNTQHLPTSYIDGSGQQTSYVYNQAGELLSTTDPLGYTNQCTYNSITQIAIGGTASASRTEKIIIGGTPAQYVTTSSDTLATIASSLSTAINNLNLSGVSSTTNGTTIQVQAPAGTVFTSSTQGAITIGLVSPLTIGGTINTTSYTQTVTINSTHNATYPTQSNDTPSSVANALSSAINALAITGVTATTVGPVILITAPSGTTIGSTAAGLVTITPGSIGNAFLTQIQGPLSGNLDISSYTWNLTGTLLSKTDSEGYSLNYLYDNLDRRTQTNYPDGSSEKTVYQYLDAIFAVDRLGRTTTDTYDSLDRLISETDPLGRTTQYTWCTCGSLATLTDPLGQITTWNHDLQGRLTQKIYQDSSEVNYTYEPCLSLLMLRTDALSQTKFYNYNLDNSVSVNGYLNVTSANYTPNVIWTYDQSFMRPTQVQNSEGYSSAYQYNNYITDPFGTAITGGGKLQQITNSPITSSNITFTYDADGRLTNRSIGSSNSVTLSYDGLSRLTSEVNPLCSGSSQFSYSYIDQTPTDKGTFRLAQIGYPNGQTTNLNYYSTTFDERLKQINNLAGGSASAGISQFDYGYDSAGEITTWGQQQYQRKSSDALSYDAAGQLVADQGGFGVPLPPYSRQHYFSYDSGANTKSVQHDTIQNLLISGTITASTGNLLVTINDPGLSGGTETVNYAVQSSDTTAAKIATNLAAAITADINLQALGISATPNGPNVLIRSVSSNVTTFSPPTTANGATETLTLGNNNAVENITIGGTGSGRTITIKINDASLSGGYVNVTYMDSSSQSPASIAAGLCSNLQTALASTPFTVTQVGGSSTPVIAIQSTSPNVTNYSFTVSGTGTPSETVAIAPVLSGSQTFLMCASGSFVLSKCLRHDFI